MLIGRRPIGTVAMMGGTFAVPTDFCWAFAQLVSYSLEFVCERTETIYLDRAKISFHSWARNDLVNKMRGDWLLMLDTDHAPGPDLLGRLLHRMNEHDLDVICGIYQFKTPPHAPVLYGWYQPSKANEGGFAPLVGWGPAGEVIPVDGAGAGAMLVKRRVFDKIEAELHERPFDVIGQMGEDLSFFKRLRTLGIKAYVDRRVESPHLQVRPVRQSDFDPKTVNLKKVRLPDAKAFVGGK